MIRVEAEALDSTGDGMEQHGERRFWMLLWLFSLLVIACTYLTPFFFEWIPLNIFLRDASGIADSSFSADRFWRSSVVPHCFFSGYILSMRLASGGTLERRIWWIVAAEGAIVLYLISLELLQVLIPGRTISGGDVLIHLIAYTAGAALGGSLVYCLRFTHSGLHFSSQCIGVWVFVLIYLSIYPISFRTDRSGSLMETFLLSLKAIPRKSDVLANLLLGCPIALLYLDALGAQKESRNGWTKGMRPVVSVLTLVFIAALSVETIQYFFAERYPSLYDILFQLLGAASVWGIFRRIYRGRIGIQRQVLDYLGGMRSSGVALIAFSVGFLIFEWTPWFPSIEVSTIKESVRELVLPFTTPDYPWDLHWEANRLGIAFVFACSVTISISWYMLLRSTPNAIQPTIKIMSMVSFYGLAVELGKVVISTKNVTPVLILSSFFGGLSVFLVVLVVGNWEQTVRMKSNNKVEK
jgi:VanZ family protein